MPSLFRRAKNIFDAKADEKLSKHEDPRKELDYSYNQQLALLQKVRRGVADISTSIKRLEIQRDAINKDAEKYTLAAQRALESNREDLAREALTRKGSALSQLEPINAQIQQLGGELQKLVASQDKLQARVNDFRTRKETLKASYSAAEAQTKINETLSGIGENMETSLAGSMQAAEDKILTMQARSQAIG